MDKELAIMLVLGLLVGIPIGICLNNQANGDIPTIREAYCPKYTQTISEYKACKASNLVEYIEKEGGKWVNIILNILNGLKN